MTSVISVSTQELPLVVWLNIGSSLPHGKACAALSATGRSMSKVVLRAAYERKKDSMNVHMGALCPSWTLGRTYLPTYLPGCMHIASRVRASGSTVPALVAHHAVLDTAAQKVIHYSRHDGDDAECTIRVDSIDVFRKDFGTWCVVCLPNSREHSKEVLTRAMSRLGESNYNVVSNNCETFATWCFEEVEASTQVRAGVAVGASGVVAAGTSGVAASTSTAYLYPSDVLDASSVKTYTAGTVVSGGSAVGVGVLLSSVAILYGVSRWIAHGQQKVAARVPIYIFNDSDETIHVHITSESVFDSVYKLRETFAVGQMSQSIASRMAGELGPPIPGTSFKLMTLRVWIEEVPGYVYSSWNEICKAEVRRGDALIFRHGLLTQVLDPDCYGERR